MFLFHLFKESENLIYTKTPKTKDEKKAYPDGWKDHGSFSAC